MVYLPRKLSVNLENDSEIECDESEFFRMGGPHIVIGEPGAGKSELIKHFGLATNSEVIRASTVEAHPSIIEKEWPSTTIIDGLDEVTAYEEGIPINRILTKLANFRKPNFVLTCRAADWQHVVNAGIISERWNVNPVVGRILPLTNNEIEEFVNSNSDGLNGADFIRDAITRGALELLRNPQYLILFIQTVKKHGWPNSKFELYEKACLSLVDEENQTHRCLNRSISNNERLVGAAGLICTQLLLADSAGVCINGSTNSDFVRITDLVVGTSDTDKLREVIKTKLFRPSSVNIFETIHRSIAEFLAAKWISKQLNESLSQRRIENILYGHNYIVPSSLRGLHAWIAVMNSQVTNLYIERDAYGFFRYGDLAVLSISQIKHLLNCMQKTATDDPYFRNQDWGVAFGQELAKKELKVDIVKIIKNPKVPHQLSHLILESLKGNELVSEIANELKEIAFNKKATYSERNASTEALLENCSQENYIQYFNDFYNMDDVESLRLALDIIYTYIDEFEGSTIADLLVKLEEEIESGIGPRYAGLGWGITKKLTIEQLESGLCFLADKDPTEQSVEKLVEFAQERLTRSDNVPASTIWNWIKPIDQSLTYYSNSEWNSFTDEYFADRVEMRRCIQNEAFKGCESSKDLWHRIWSIKDAGTGLLLKEEDCLFHMNQVIANKENTDDWRERWGYFVLWGLKSTQDTSNILIEARRHVVGDNQLAAILDQFENPSISEQEKEFQQEMLAHKEKELAEIRERHEVYSKFSNSVRTGENFHLVYQVAMAYLGRYSNIDNNKSPDNRIKQLVGDNNYNAAKDGIKNIVDSTEIPTARKIIELHARENKTYHIEPVLIARSLMLLNDGLELTTLPIDTICSTLATCEFGIGNGGEDGFPDLKNILLDIVFNSQETNANYLKDLIEPYLDAKKESNTFIYNLARTKAFEPILPTITLEWLNKYNNLPISSLSNILEAAIIFAPRDLLVSLIRKKISSLNWADEPEKDVWISAAFLTDFEYHNEELLIYAREKKSNLWPIRDLTFQERDEIINWPKLNEPQLNLLITNFAPVWPPTEPPADGWSGNKNPYDAFGFIHARITQLANCMSEAAVDYLSEMVTNPRLSKYHDTIKHVLATLIRNRAEKNKSIPAVSEINSIVGDREPKSIDDLQAIVLDELESAQLRLRGSPSNDILPYWDGEIPHNENYCRDRLLSYLEPYLSKYDIRTYKEPSMPDEKRCDLLNTYREMDLPIEVKGQWHKDIWTAANNQLQSYTKEYRAEGRGIYLILWFGKLATRHNKNPRAWKGKKTPTTLMELEELIDIKYSENLSEKTKIIVLNLTKSSKST